MKDTLVGFEVAKLAYENKFDVDCDENYSNNGELVHNFSYLEAIYSAPTQSLLQRWLREKHDIHILIDTDNCKEFGTCLNVTNNPDESGYWTYFYNSYEDALEFSLQQALNLINNEDH